MAVARASNLCQQLPTFLYQHNYNHHRHYISSRKKYATTSSIRPNIMITSITSVMKSSTEKGYLNLTEIHEKYRIRSNQFHSSSHDFSHVSPTNSSTTSHDLHQNQTLPTVLKLDNVRSWWRWRNDNNTIPFVELFPKDSKLHQLSNLLEEHAVYASQWDDFEPDDPVDDRRNNRFKRTDRNYVAWTISGLIMALAEEATDLDVEVDANYSTPLWNRTVDAIRIKFSKLVFKPLRMRGLDRKSDDVKQSQLGFTEQNNPLEYRYNTSPSPDEAFDRIDTDNSGALDVNELVSALRSVTMDERRDGSMGEGSTKSLAVLSDLARRLVRLYDSNGDGVVDRGEYKDMVKDMTTLRSNRKGQKSGLDQIEKVSTRKVSRLSTLEPIVGLLKGVSSSTMYLYRKFIGHQRLNGLEEPLHVLQDIPTLVTDFTNDPLVNILPKGEITISDLSLDLRRLLFGAVPIMKRITPGGPLVLDPFNVTVSASFNREDIMSSNLLDAGLRQLVRRALRRRVRSFRDFFDGAVFYGRTWTMASEEAPVVDVPQLTNVEFDEDDRLILTGRARIRASPDQPFIENAFKLRTRLGTRENGQFIRLQDPELAIGLECPNEWEENIKKLYRALNIYNPTRPSPIDIFFPLVSPLKATDQDGFNLGEENRINSIYIKDGALHFEVSSTLRPGRFLGNYYIAFVVPNRTFIITMDRVLEGIRAARRNKREQKLAQQRKKQQQVHDKQLNAEDSSYKNAFTSFTDPKTNDWRDGGLSRDAVILKRPNFFSRFLEGYMEAAREETDEERNERISRALAKLFGTSENGVW